MRNKRYQVSGEQAVRAGFTLIFFTLIILFGMEMYRIYTYDNAIAGHLQAAALAQVTNNYDDIYTGTKKQSASAFVYNEGAQEFVQNFDYGRILQDMADDLGLTVIGDRAVSDDGSLVLSNVRSELVSAPKEINSPGVFKTKVYVDMEIKLGSILKNTPTYKATVTTLAKYIKKF